MKKINKAFTLVELIVVITILAVLWTIAFVSFQWYAASSRDSVRITDLKNIDKVLKLKVTAWETLLLPEQALKITASWTTLSYQWNMSEKLLNHYGITNGWLDPLDNIPYTYSVNENRNKYQLLWFLETWDSVALNVAQTFADNSQRFPKTTWDTLWILLDETTNIPLVESWSTTELDIETTADTYWLIIQNSTSIQKWDKEFLRSELDFRIYPKWNCQNILLNWLSKGNGLYVINPTWVMDINVYCDMITDGGWWTAVLNMWQDFFDYNVDGDVGCNTNKDLCISSAWSQLKINDIMFEWAEQKIVNNNYQTKFIFNSPVNTKDKTLKYLMNNDWVTNCSYGYGWGIWNVTKVIKALDKGIMWPDYDSLLHDKAMNVCIKDWIYRPGDNYTFILWSTHGNSAGWPQNVYNKHWHKFYRVFVR